MSLNIQREAGELAPEVTDFVAYTRLLVDLGRLMLQAETVLARELDAKIRPSLRGK